MTPTQSRELASLIQTFSPSQKADFYYFTIVKNEDPMAYISNMRKATFNGDRSAAGRYAANVRWQGNVKKPDSERVDEIRSESLRVSELLAQLPPYENNIAKAGANPKVKPSEWATVTGNAIVLIKGKAVVTAPVIEAEKAVNALGVKVLDLVRERLKANPRFKEMLENEEKLRTETEGALKELRRLDTLVANRDASLPENFRKIFDLIKYVEGEIVTEKVTVSKLRAETKKAKEAFKEAEKTGDSYRQWKEWQIARRAQSLKNFDLINLQKRLKQEQNNLMKRVEENDEYKSVKEKANQSFSDTQELQQATFAYTVSLLKEVRETGGSLNFKGKTMAGSSTVDKLVDYVADILPKPFITKLNSQKEILKITLVGDGGSYEASVNTITTTVDKDVLLHETIHAITYADPVSRLLEQATLQRRTYGNVGDTTTPFAKKVVQGRQELVNRPQFLKNGRLYYNRGDYIQDNFKNLYMGRQYTGRSNWLPSTEVFTVGMNQFQGEGVHWDKGTGVDSDVANTVVGWLFSEGGT